MCQVFIGKVLSGEMRVVVMQLSSSRLAYRHSEAHRGAAVLVMPSIESDESEIIAGTPEHITAQLTQISACILGQGEGMAIVITMSLSFWHFAGSEHGLLWIVLYSLHSLFADKFWNMLPAKTVRAAAVAAANEVPNLSDGTKTTPIRFYGDYSYHGKP